MQKHKIPRNPEKIYSDLVIFLLLLRYFKGPRKS